MGQGTDSCGGWELEYDPYDSTESEGFRIWNGKDGDYYVDTMSNPHIENAIKLCEKLSACATFSCESEKWDTWVDVFYQELSDRSSKGIYLERLEKKIKNSPAKSRKGDGKRLIKSIKNYKFESSSQKMKCHCGEVYTAKVADLKRGWALSCSKSCAALRRDFGKQPATICK